MSITGERIRQLRKNRGITQAELGKLLQVENSTISMYERGNAQPPNENIIKMSKIFNVSTDYLLGNVDSPEIKKRSVNEIISDVETLFFNGGHNLSDEKKKMLARIIKATIEEE